MRPSSEAPIDPSTALPLIAQRSSPLVLDSDCLVSSQASVCELAVETARIQAKAEASAEFEQAARSTSAGRTVERDPVVAALIERLERRADTEGRRS